MKTIFSLILGREGGLGGGAEMLSVWGSGGHCGVLPPLEHHYILYNPQPTTYNQQGLILTFYNHSNHTKTFHNINIEILLLTKECPS